MPPKSYTKKNISQEFSGIPTSDAEAESDVEEIAENPNWRIL